MKKKNIYLKILIFILKIIWFIIKIPYYIALGIIYLTKRTTKEVNEENIKRKRGSMIPIYKEIKLIKTEKGNFQKFLKEIYTSDSKIGIIIGARGTGKTAFGLKILEDINFKNKNCYAMGFDENEMPSWINIVQNISELKNDSFVLIDEGGILFNSRNSMANVNKLLSDLILISRHKNLSILFISQNSSNLDVNILRQADFLILKPSSLLQKDFERKIIQKIYDKISDEFKNYKDKGITYIYSNPFQGFVSNPLPSFWKTEISKSFRSRK